MFFCTSLLPPSIGIVFSSYKTFRFPDPINFRYRFEIFGLLLYIFLVSWLGIWKPYRLRLFGEKKRKKCRIFNIYFWILENVLEIYVKGFGLASSNAVPKHAFLAYSHGFLSVCEKFEISDPRPDFERPTPQKRLRGSRWLRAHVRTTQIGAPLRGASLINYRV